MKTMWRRYETHPTFQSYCHKDIPLNLEPDEMPVQLLLVPSFAMRKYNDPALLNTQTGQAMTIGRATAAKLIVHDILDHNARFEKELH
jgi:hypothetical protein